MASRKSRRQVDASLESKARSKSDIAEWAKALLDARNCGDEPVPDGFLTINQISDQLELARSTAHILVE
jgi:alpha-D-ribose 1-methylphosphonate 5-triphosphate synthase subunit PhnI